MTVNTTKRIEQMLLHLGALFCRRFVRGMLFKYCGTANIQRFYVREIKLLTVVFFSIYVCLILEFLKFSATSELGIFNFGLNRSSCRMKDLQRQ